MASIEGIPSSNQIAAAAGTGGALSTGFDRKVKLDPNAKAPENGPNTGFKDLLIEMISSDGISEVNVKRERKPLEEELLYQQELKRISENRLNSVVRKKDEKKRQKKRLAQELEKEKGSEETGKLSPAAQYLSFSERVKLIEESLLKDYVFLTAKAALGKNEEPDTVRISLAQAREALMKAGLSEGDFKYLDQKARDMIKESFFRLIKDRFFASVNSPLDMSGWILNAKSPKSIIDILNALEKETLTLSDRAKVLDGLDVSDMVQLARHLNLDIDSIMDLFTRENIKVGRDGGSDIFFHMFDIPRIRDVSPMIDDFRSFQTDQYLEDNPIKRIPSSIALRRLEVRLREMGLDKETIESIKTQSRRIAWLKTISDLKESHLQRILTSSSREFDKVSGAITKLTNRSNSLGYDIPKEGIKWIESGLENLALETARYKLELLRSLQKLSFEESRNRDIQHLTSVISAIKRRAGL